MEQNGFRSKEHVTQVLNLINTQNPSSLLLFAEQVENDYWMLHQSRADRSRRWITLAQISQTPGEPTNWKYSLQSESDFDSHAQTTCPIPILRRSTHSNSLWRIHALMRQESVQLSRKALDREYENLSVTRGGRTFKFQERIGHKGWLMTCAEENNKLYRFPVSQLGEFMKDYRREKALAHYATLHQDASRNPVPFEALSDLEQAFYENAALGGTQCKAMEQIMQTTTDNRITSLPRQRA